MDMELRVTQLMAPINRNRTDPLPQIVIEETKRAMEGSEPSSSPLFPFRETPSAHRRRYSLPEVSSSLPDMTSCIPEITYGMRPRMAWIYRYMY